MPHTQKSVATEFLTKCAHGHSAEAFSLHAHPDFKHHNPHTPADSGALIAAMKAAGDAYPHLHFHILHMVEEKNMVVIQSKLMFTPESKPLLLFHMFRFEDGKIIELWDVGQEEPDEKINENGMF